MVSEMLSSSISKIYHLKILLIDLIQGFYLLVIFNVFCLFIFNKLCFL